MISCNEKKKKNSSYIFAGDFPPLTIKDIKEKKKKNDIRINRGLFVTNINEY